MSTANCYVQFWENKNKEDGGYHQFNGPVQVPDLSQDYYDGEKHNFSNEMDDSISSMETGSQAWCIIYSGSNYTGDQVLVGPSTYIPDLSAIGSGKPDMNNTIASFQLFDALPVNTQNVLANFLNLYPGSVKTYVSGDACIEWYAQDSHYRCYYPSILQSGNTVNFSMRMDHIIGGAFESDDHATVTFSMDTSGNFVDRITISYDMSSGAAQIPQWMLNFIDDGIDEAADEAIAFLDGAEIVFTAGLGTELIIPTDILILAGAEVLTIAVNHLNEVMDKLFALSDNGGSMYFPAIAAHGAARLTFAYLQELYGGTGSLLSFDQSAFQRYFNTTWDDSQNKSNPCLIFSVSGSDYRCYYPDNTAGFSKAGYLSSVKMDAINDNDKDDYLSLLTTFDPSGKLFSVQGTIDIYGAPDDSDDADDYVAPSSGTIAYNEQGQVVQITKDAVVPLTGYDNVADAYRSVMQTALDNVKYVDHADFSDALKHLVDASYTVVQAIDAAVN